MHHNLAVLILVTVGNEDTEITVDRCMILCMTLNSLESSAILVGIRITLKIKKMPTYEFSRQMQWV